MDIALHGPERRRAARLALNLAASVRERGRSPFTVALLDLSVLGCRIELSGDLQADSWIWLKLPGLEPRYSRVAWCKAGFAGVEFEVPLHEAVFDCLVEMDRLPSEAELSQLRSIGARCRALAARTPDRAGEDTVAQLIALAVYCEAGAAGAENRSP
jgi:hypothetical protein